MVTIEDAKRLCRQLEIKIINTADPAGPMRTSAVNTIRRMLAERGQGHTVAVLRAITEGNAVNRTMLQEYILKAVGDVVSAHPGWVKRGLEWLEAWDGVDLVQIRNSAKASGIRPLRFAIGAMVCLRLTEILGPSVLPKPPKPKVKREPKPPAWLARVPGVERNVALGLELLKLRSNIKNNCAFGCQMRRKFDVDAKLASQAMKIAKIYGTRREIYSRLSWNALVHLASPALSAAAREALESRIVTGAHIGAPEIRAARGVLKADSRRRQADQPAGRMAA